VLEFLRSHGYKRGSFQTYGARHLDSVLSLLGNQKAAGDMIATGTSVGCGIVDGPPRRLSDGDLIECEILGVPGTRNVIRIPAQRARKS
jgi:hypothetical protein